MPMPMFSPFGYGGFGGMGFGFSPFGFMPLNLNVIILGALLYTAVNALSNRAGGAAFDGSDGDVGSLGTGASVVKLQVSLDSDWESGKLLLSLDLNHNPNPYHNPPSRSTHIVSWHTTHFAPSRSPRLLLYEYYMNIMRILLILCTSRQCPGRLV
jgi:hypothetical protein